MCLWWHRNSKAHCGLYFVGVLTKLLASTKKPHTNFLPQFCLIIKWISISKSQLTVDTLLSFRQRIIRQQKANLPFQSHSAVSIFSRRNPRSSHKTAPAQKPATAKTQASDDKPPQRAGKRTEGQEALPAFQTRRFWRIKRSPLPLLLPCTAEFAVHPARKFAA